MSDLEVLKSQNPEPINNESTHEEEFFDAIAKKNKKKKKKNSTTNPNVQGEEVKEDPKGAKKKMGSYRSSCI